VKSTPKQHRIQFLGDSDTAAYCITGDPNKSQALQGALGMQYEDCSSSYASLMANHFDASIEMIAISGIGVY